MSTPTRLLGSTLRLRTFGGARVEGPDGAVVAALMQRRRLALLALLAASDAPSSRDRIVGLLWSESDEEKARHVLAQVVHSLRRDLGEDAIEGNATTLRLNPNILPSDVHDFSAAIAAAKLDVAAEAYRGPFLDGFYLNGCPEFERWTEERRAELAHDAEKALESLARSAEDPAQAVMWWRRLASMRRLDSRVALLVAQAMVRAGDRTGASEHVRVHFALLRDELEQDPPPELTAFLETLKTSVTPENANPAPPVAFATEDGPPPNRQSVRRWRRRSAAGILALASAIGAAALTIALRGDSAVPPRWVIVTDVVNTTGDRAFDHTVPVAIAAVLTQSPRVRIETPERIARALERMRRGRADSVMDEKLAREIAQRDGVQIVAVPAVDRADQGYDLSAKLIDGATGGVLAFVSERAATRSDVLDALDRLSRKIRRELGESRSSVNANAVALPQVTTTSLDALKKFADGNRAYRGARYAEAARLWEGAVALDSTFATAHSNLGMVALLMNRPSAGETHYANALRHLGGLPEREQTLIRASSKRGRRDFLGAAQLLEGYLALNPEDIEVQSRLAFDYMRMRKSAEAVAVFTKVLAVDSLNQSSWINLATAEKDLGHVTESIRAYQRAAALAPMWFTANNNVNLEFASAYVKANLIDSARAVINLLVNHADPIRRARGLRSMAFLAAYDGQYAEAARTLTQANVLIRSVPSDDAATSELRNMLLQASVLTELGRTGDAARALDSSYALVMRMDAEATIVYLLGKALARAGDTRRSTALVALLEKTARKDSPPDRAALAALRGEALVARGRPKEAIPHLEAAWVSDSAHPVIVESRAYVAAAAGDVELSVALYQRLAQGRWFGSEGQFAWQLAEYQLARLYEHVNKSADAQAAYVRFLMNWPRPDSGLLAVSDARARVRTSR